MGYYGIGNVKTNQGLNAGVGSDEGIIEVICHYCGKPHGIKVLVGDASKIILPATQYCPHCGSVVRYTFDQEGYLVAASEDEY